MKRIIGLVGRKGCGKGAVTKILAEKYGAKTFRFSAALADVLRRLGIEETNENMVRLSVILRKEFDEDVLKRAVMKDVEKTDGDLIVLDGLRRVQDLEMFEALGRFVIVSVEAPLETRYERIHGRREKSNDATITFEEFKRLQADAPTEITIPDVEARATYHIDNSGTLEELEAKIQELMKKI